jgi:predicted SnoaL-like aldol condensation-catalyzing enzyme
MTRNRQRFIRIVVLLLAGLLIMALPAVSTNAESPAAPTVAETNKQLAIQYFDDVMSAGKVATADTILASDFVRIDRSRDGVTLHKDGTEFLAAYQQLAFPQLTYTIDAMATEGDQVAVCWTARGISADFPVSTVTYRPQPEDPYASDYAVIGEPVTWTGMSFLRMAEGRIVEEMTNQEQASGVLATDVSLKLAPSYAQ